MSGTKDALAMVPPKFVCLAAVSRSADFLTEVGWLTTEAWDPPLHLSAVLRSWEDRFGPDCCVRSAPRFGSWSASRH